MTAEGINGELFKGVTSPVRLQLLSTEWSLLYRLSSVIKGNRLHYTCGYHNSVITVITDQLIALMVISFITPDVIRELLKPVITEEFFGPEVIPSVL